MMMICRTFISQTSNSSSSGSRKAREELKKKENHLHTISKMMATSIHVQLYTFSYRKAIIRPQNMPKLLIGGKICQNCQAKKNKFLKRYFQNVTAKISSEQLRKVEKVEPFDHSGAPKKMKKSPMPRGKSHFKFPFSFWNPSLMSGGS